MKHLEITTVNEFHEMIRGHWDSHYFYRGEDSDKYHLRPKFGRDQITSKKNTPSVEYGILTAFKRLAIPYLPYNPRDDWDWLAIAQHHGIHTRLLDWTQNPLTAAYFSVNHKYESDSVIYVFKSADVPDVNEETSPTPFEIQSVMLLRPRNLMPRISAQSALFTVHPDPSIVFDVPSLERIVIKESCKLDLELVLHTYNVNHFTMFPDLDGCAQHLNMWWIHRA